MMKFDVLLLSEITHEFYQNAFERNGMQRNRIGTFLKLNIIYYGYIPMVGEPRSEREGYR